MVLEQLDIHMWTNEGGTLSHTIFKEVLNNWMNKVQVDQKPKCKS